MLVHYHMNFKNALSPDHDQTGWSPGFKAMHLFQGYEVYWQKMYTTISITSTYPNKSMNNENYNYLPQQCQNSMAIYWRQKKPETICGSNKCTTITKSIKINNHD